MHFPRMLKASALAVTIALGVAAAADAQVFEIGDDGQIAQFKGPAVFTVDGARPLVMARPADEGDSEVRRQISATAAEMSLDPNLLEAVAWRESRFRQSARSPRGATGVMQLMPGTARDLGVDASDMAQNVRGGAQYLRQMLSQFRGDLKLSLAAYNAGPAAVRKHGGVPPFAETQAYVSAVLGRMAVTAVTAPALGVSN